MSDEDIRRLAASVGCKLERRGLRVARCAVCDVRVEEHDTYDTWERHGKAVEPLTFSCPGTP